jgi:hypothetical protein
MLYRKLNVKTLNETIISIMLSIQTNQLVIINNKFSN